VAAQPCIECGVRPKALPRQRCTVCALRHAPIGDQVAASRRRLAMIPPELRVKRSKKIMAEAPAGTAFCAACQSFRDDVDFGKGATTCHTCSSAKSHAAMIEKTYGLTAEGYDALLELQGGRCAICRNRPGKKRFAVDHDHMTGAVRGLLCSTDNHDLLGAGYDSIAKLGAAVHYLMHPPASGAWWSPESGLVVEATRSGAERPADPSAPVFAQPSASNGNMPQRSTSTQSQAFTPQGPLMVGGGRDERGAYKVYVDRDDMVTVPF
jgi:hypothetical protein